MFSTSWRRHRPKGSHPGGHVPRVRSTDSSRPRSAAETEIERERMSERRRVGTQIDIELRVACRMEAAARRELGDAARGLLRRRAYRGLGFVRLRDYARERLRVSPPPGEEAGWGAARPDPR